MLAFQGMPARNMMTLVPDERGRHVEKRISRVSYVSEVIETPLDAAPPVRTQLVSVLFDDGTSRIGCVTL